MTAPTAEQLQLEIDLIKEKLADRNETIGQLNNKVDLMDAELQALKQHQATQVQQEKEQGVEQVDPKASPEAEQQVESQGRVEAAPLQGLGQQDIEFDVYGQTPSWNSLESTAGVWCCSRCGWELEGEGEGECCAVRYQWEWGPEGPNGELNTAYDDLDDIQVEPRETSPSPQVHQLESDAFPNPSPELGVPGPPQRDSPRQSFLYQFLKGVVSEGSDSDTPPNDSTASASAEGSDDDMDDPPPALDRFEQHELESRGATLSMIQTFHVRFDYSLGIIAWLDNCLMDEFASETVAEGESWKVYLGREIHLHESDLDGSRYIFEIIDDSHSADGYGFTTFRAQVSEGQDGLIVTCPASSLQHIPEKPMRDAGADHAARELLDDEAKKQWDDERAAETVIKNEVESEEGETEPEPVTGEEDEGESSQEDDVEMEGAAAEEGVADSGEEEEEKEGTPKVEDSIQTVAV